ncbi:MAG: hypothetical protein IJC09_03400 [Clostridia bacterium]|nr:hypothetical protein [Clostridia bacterium]
MLGILIYLFFLISGYSYSCCVFKDKDIFFRSWMGGIFGNVLLMAGVVIPSIFLGFTYASHIVLMLLSVLPLIFIIRKKGIKEFKSSLLGTGGEECGLDIKVFLGLIIPIVLVISVIMTNHILAPYESGGVASGQSTFGDLQMHLGFVTSIAEQHKFPPNYAFLDGQLLNYPFFVNMLSSSLYLFGTSLRLAVLIPSYVLSLLLVIGFYIIAYRLTKRKSASVLATVLFFFGGGFGFAYFLNGAKADPNVFNSIFTEYYHTPTNLPDYNLRWVNPICDMIIPQRTIMAGWCIFFPALWLLLEALQTKQRKFYVTLGILAGCMPMIHTHTFLALGMICAVLFFAYIVNEQDKKGYTINWVIFGAIVFTMAMPQLFFWTFRQSANNDSFLRYGLNWVNHNDTYFWFYLKNWGVTALFAIPAILHASKDNKKLLLACGFIFCIAELVLFQPNEYDNNKLFFIAYMILLIAVSDWLVHMWDLLKGVKGRVYLAVITVFAGTFSGTLSVIREYNSGADYQTFSDYDIEMAEYIKENTPSDAVFLTSTYHLNPVVTLAGRNIYLGSSLYVYFHGLDDDYYNRNSQIAVAYTGDYENLIAFCEENGIDYVYVGENERNEYSPSEEMLGKLQMVYSSGTETLYKVN